MGDDPQPTRHQMSEVPRAKAEVTEYRRHTYLRPSALTIGLVLAAVRLVLQRIRPAGQGEN